MYSINHDFNSFMDASSEYTDALSNVETTVSLIEHYPENRSPNSQESFFVENLPEVSGNRTDESINGSPPKFGIYINDAALASFNSTQSKDITHKNSDNSFQNNTNHATFPKLENEFIYNSEHSCSSNTVATNFVLGHSATKSNASKKSPNNQLNKEDKSSSNSSHRIISSHYSPLQNKGVVIQDIEPIPDLFIKPREIYISDRSNISLVSSSTQSSLDYNDTVVPDIKKAVKLLKNEMLKNSPKLRASTPKFKPTKYNMASNSMKRNSLLLNPSSPSSPKSQVPSSPFKKSLLNNHLSPVEDKSHLTSNINNETDQKDFTSQSIPTGLPNLSYGNDFSESQIDTTIDTLQNYRNLTYKRYDIDIEAMNNIFRTESDNDSINGINLNINDDSIFPKVPIQHVDSNSIYTFDSKIYGFSEVYSIWRMFLVLMCCILVPLLFFVISINGEKKKLVSDYQLMRMVFNKNHRIGLLKGFNWELDVQWIRHTFLILGLIETSVILACIGIGFGVGITNE